MIVQPNFFGNICTTAHPLGCYQNVEMQINYMKSQEQFSGIKNALIIGSSTGYGLASQIAATFGASANTIGVFFEKAGTASKTATPGWYNMAALEQIAHEHGYYVKSINGDAFTDEVKQKTAELIKNDLKKIDLIIYSLASPRRKDSVSSQVYHSVLKTVGQPFAIKTLKPFDNEIYELTVEPATHEEISNTIKVMGGEDWMAWVNFLHKENLLSEGVLTIAYSYLGSELLSPIYRLGTIGKAKEHLHHTATMLNETLKPLGGNALISVNKAVVTQASAAIPGVPLYLSILTQVLKKNNTNEGCIEQINRLFSQKIFGQHPLMPDEQQLIRLDDFELSSDVQEHISRIWSTINSENLTEFADVHSYRNDFKKLFGFGVDRIEYDLDVNPIVGINSI